MQSCIRISSCLLVLIVSFKVAAQEAESLESAPSPNSIEFPIQKILPALKADGLEIPEQTLILSDQQGWLLVSLYSSSSELEWKIVLAEIDSSLEPKIELHQGLPFVSVQYGPYFIREALGRLRVHRQEKDRANDEWPAIEEVPDDKPLCRAGRLFVVIDGDWCWVCTSPKYDNKNVDSMIRFQHIELKKGHGSTVFADGKLAEVFCGDARCHDEGDLLVAQRFPVYGAKAMLASKETKETLVGSQALPLSSSAIFGDATSDLASLKGKVVLLDFWGQWCKPCVEKLPIVSELHQKYNAQGLEVIGIHSQQSAEELESFLASNDITFPCIIDDGETALKYGVSSWPTYFLIGRDGKVCWGFNNNPPSEALIKRELAKDN